MKKFFSFFLLCIIITTTSAQTQVRDSLRAILSKTTVDTTRVNLIVQLSRFEPTYKERIAQATEGLALAQKIKYKAGEANASEHLGAQYRVFGNYPLALHHAFSSLRLREELNDTAGMSGGYFIVGLVYQEMGDFDNALISLQKVLRYNSPDNIHLAGTANAAVGSVYYNLNKMDSALQYYQKSNEYFNLDSFKLAYCKTLTGLGDLQFEKGNNEIAIGYYREAVRNCATYIDTTGYTTTYDRMAIFFHAMQNRDSTIKYSQLTLQCATPLNNYSQINRSAAMLSKLYEDEDAKLSLSYLQTANAATDSLISLQKTGQLQSLFLAQTEKEQADAEKKLFDLEKDNQNIQYALMAIGIISFIFIFLLLSHRFITNTRIIGLLSGIAFLLVFEFLNLLLHSFLNDITNHSPLIMLLALVCIAALLVPLHHKVDHWAKEKLVEKNKAMRLAAAKKTIEQLDIKTEEL